MKWSDTWTAGPSVRGPDFWSEILFGPVRGPDFGRDFYLVRYVVRDVLVTAPAVVEHEYLGTLCNLKYLFQLYLFKSVKAIYISVLKL